MTTTKVLSANKFNVELIEDGSTFDLSVTTADGSGRIVFQSNDKSEMLVKLGALKVLIENQK